MAIEREPQPLSEKEQQVPLEHSFTITMVRKQLVQLLLNKKCQVLNIMKIMNHHKKVDIQTIIQVLNLKLEYLEYQEDSPKKRKLLLLTLKSLKLLSHLLTKWFKSHQHMMVKQHNKE